MSKPGLHPDGDEHKGAVEDDSPLLPGQQSELHGSLSGQLGHRNQDATVEGSDTDYPEPGSNPEHSGQRR